MSTKKLKKIKSSLNVNYDKQQIKEIEKLCDKVYASKSKVIRAITQHGLNYAKTLNKSDLIDFIRE